MILRLSLTPFSPRAILGLLFSVLMLTSPLRASDFTERLAELSAIKVKSLIPSDVYTLPVGTEGGDLATLVANGGTETTTESLLGRAGWKLRLEQQPKFEDQVRNYLEGRTPFLRGTISELATYSEVLNQNPNTRPVVFLLLSWSHGSHCLITREGLAAPSELIGKTLLVPRKPDHIEFMDRLLRDSGLSWDDVTIRWHEDEGTVTEEFRRDLSIDAIFCNGLDARTLMADIREDADLLRPEGRGELMLSTRTASRLVAEVYAVRSDFAAMARQRVLGFVRAQLEAQRRLAAIVAADEAKGLEEFLTVAAEFYLKDSTRGESILVLLEESTLPFGPGNRDFFSNAGNLAGFGATVSRNLSWLREQGIVSSEQTLDWANWDWRSVGVSPGARVSPSFGQLETLSRIRTEGKSRVLFESQITFGPNQTDFDSAEYGAEFRKAIELAAAYANAVVEIVGHTDTTKFVELRDKNPTDAVLERFRQAGQNLSTQRANEARRSLVKFAKENLLAVNEEQFLSTGRGYDLPVVEAPETEDDMAKNRRVQFRLISLEEDPSKDMPVLNEGL